MNVCKIPLFARMLLTERCVRFKPLFPCVTHNKGSVVKIDLLESWMALGIALMCNAGLFKYG